MQHARDAILFVHLIAVAIFFMTLGVEALAVMNLAKRPAVDVAQTWLSPLRGAVSLDQYALVALFLTGGYLINGLATQGEKMGFLVTLLLFFVIGGLTGMAGGRYRKLQRLIDSGGSPAEIQERMAAPMIQSALRMRIVLLAAVLLLVSLKTDLMKSLIIFGVFLVIGIAASFPKRQSV